MQVDASYNILVHTAVEYSCIFVVVIDKRKISKRNLPNVGTAGWLEVLADKVHKQGVRAHSKTWLYTFHYQNNNNHSTIIVI